MLDTTFTSDGMELEYAGKESRNHIETIGSGRHSAWPWHASGRGDEEEVPHREVGANGLANRTLSLWTG